MRRSVMIGSAGARWIGNSSSNSPSFVWKTRKLFSPPAGGRQVPDRRLVNSFYTHRLDELLSISGAKSAFETRAAGDVSFVRNWNTAIEWSEVVRYDLLITEALARKMHDAITNATSGVLPWLKTQW